MARAQLGLQTRQTPHQGMASSLSPWTPLGRVTGAVSWAPEVQVPSAWAVTPSLVAVSTGLTRTSGPAEGVARTRRLCSRGRGRPLPGARGPHAVWGHRLDLGTAAVGSVGGVPRWQPPPVPHPSLCAAPPPPRPPREHAPWALASPAPRARRLSHPHPRRDGPFWFATKALARPESRSRVSGGASEGDCPFHFQPGVGGTRRGPARADAASGRPPGHPSLFGDLVFIKFNCFLFWP